jgi:CRISPR-associated protein Cas1
MAILYVDRKDMEIREEGNHLCLYENGARRSTVPLNLLERVVIRGRVSLNSAVLTRLAEHDVGLLVLGGRQQRQMAMLVGKPHGDTQRRIAQYRWLADPLYRSRWSLGLVRLKLKTQRRFLLRAAALRPECKTALLGAAEKIERALNGLNETSPAPGMEGKLKGIEGAAANAYFSGFIHLFPPALDFTGRNRRPPRDPVNAVLSLAYTLLHYEAVVACQAVGLDPYVGFFHDPAYHRESLASDLIEPLRAKMDAWVWRLFADRKLRGDHFSQQENACLLGKAGRQTFYVEFERMIHPLRRLLRRWSLGIARKLLESESLEP